jgi:hypothetical protein
MKLVAHLLQVLSFFAPALIQRVGVLVEMWRQDRFPDPFRPKPQIFPLFFGNTSAFALLTTHGSGFTVS